MTGAAPSLLAAWTATTNSGRFDVMTATRSPRPTPRRGQVLGQRVGGPVQLPVGPAVVAGQDGRVIGELLGRRLEPVMHEARCHGETFFSELRFSVNTNEVYGYRRHEQPEHRPATDEDVRSEIIETVRRFVEREVIPVASDLERSDTFPEAIVEQMRALGLFGVTIPEEYGGLGLDLLTYIGIIEELAYGWMSLTGIVNTHTMAATMIMTHGTEEQKRRWLPAMATGERRGALSLSEPDAGSDTRNISCRALRDGDEYVLNGTKAWVTNGERASIVAAGRPGRGGHHRLHRREGARPALRRHRGEQAHGQAGLPRRRDGRDGVHRPPHPRRQRRRRARARPAPDPRRARGGPHQHCGAGGRRGPGRLRRRPGLQPAARDHGQGHRRAPGHSAEAGRHGDPTWRRPAC